MSIKQRYERVTSEHVMLLVLLVLSAVFLIEPIVSDYPGDARVFPQMTAGVVFVGSLLLLLQNYLPERLYTVVAESVNITSSGPSPQQEVTNREAETAGTTPKKTLGREYGYDVNDTVFMVVSAVLYFFAGWAAGFLFVTPLFVFAYTAWFRVRTVVGVVLAILSTVVVYLFVEFLILPLDRGAIFDFSPFLPIVLDPAALLMGVA